MAGAASGFRVVDYESLQGGSWRPDQISDRRNALGWAPAPILYLWVFQRPDSLSAQLISHGWVQLGPIYVLASADARIEGDVLRTASQIDDRMARFSHDAGSHKSPRFADFEAVASYRGYPINPLWCTEAIWKKAFQKLVGRSTYFVADVTAEDHATGLAFELQHLFSTVAGSRIILLMDRYRADRDEIVSFLSSLWEEVLSDRDPGRTERPAVITYSSANIGYLAKAAWSQWTGRPAVPLADRAASFANWH